MNKIIYLLKSEIIILLAKLMGFSFSVALTEKELNQVHWLRWFVYGEEGYIDKDAYPDKRLVDKYDPFSINIYASHKGKIVGAVRLIPSSQYKFPTENLFNIQPVGNPESTLEIARLIILPEYRSKKLSKQRRVVMFGLAYKMLRYSYKNGYEYWLANMPEKLADSFKQFGAYFEKLPEKEPTQENIAAREVIAGYFNQRVLFPYLLSVKTIVKHGIRFRV